jgi:tetratricopeptide (TPR) repeat protein
MRTLRIGRDARTALVLLAQHDERFPRGAFTAEATVLRIEALLALGRRDEALAVLDEAPLPSLPNRDEQLVVRGELRAEHGRWRDAARDFDEALTGRALPATSAKERTLHERALWGRAAARSRLGDHPGARADLDLYLRYFPDGLFAATAALLLKGAP